MLREARERLGISAEALGHQTGMSGEVIRQYESGARYPTRDAIERLAEALEAPELPELYFTREDVRDVRGAPSLVTAVKRLMRKMGLS
jgi:transcriptional regulator with XRE-family HTH domain